MNRRLQPQPGEWIDRQRPVDFRFEGTNYQGLHGDVLASALWANDVRLLGRSFKYHRPRSLYSLAGHDANLMVEGDQQTNLRGDFAAITPGLDVRSVNTVGGVRRDWLRFTEWFASFLPVGFYYKAFHTPRQLFPFYENQMRKVAGLGRIKKPYRCPASPKDYAFCDLLVVGAGPAGMAAAVAAAEQGLEVVVAEEQPRPGGSLAWQIASDSQAQDSLTGLIQRVKSLETITLRCNTQAAGVYADHWVALVGETHLTKLRAKALLVATGCFEQPAVFQNNDLPGVMLGSAAQRLIHLYAIKPFDKAVVLAANRDAYRLALDLHEAGVVVTAVVDLRSDGEPAELAQRVADFGIPVRLGHAVFEAIPGPGNRTIQGAIVCPLDRQGKPREDLGEKFECDGIAVSVGWMANGGLISQSGGKFHYSEAVEQLVPAQLTDGLFAAGRVNGVFEWKDQIVDGRRAGLAAAIRLGRYNGPIPAPLKHQAAPPSHPYPIFDHAGKKNFVDFDEDLHLSDFANAHQEGYDNVELLKRFTTVGMGPSQGKLSNFNAVRILARLNGASINETGTTTSRPFHQPVPLSHLAGRRFHPQRRSPIHSWHLRNGGQMIFAGTWLRPEYYALHGKSRARCIVDEAVNVRTNVGLVDVSTLGKIQVRGRDAVRFLEYIYTGRFTKQAVGRLRYCLACDESAVVIEDGVVARLAEDRFYLTATSSGAAAFYRELQRWALLQAMDVTLINATGQLAAVNIAGPNSRTVLKQLTSIDLSPQAFGYLEVREGSVANVDATLMRVGFVGELGYEIHVPASSALHVWTAIMDAGTQLGIRAFGVEAQRLLRLEKGHLIVGQDTDALTTPGEADLRWAIGKNKKAFVGSQTLRIIDKKPLKRRLVGLVFSHETSEVPKECHLVIERGEIVGRVTSVAAQSTLGHPVALGFLRPDLAKIGRRVTIRLDQGNLVEAEVAKLPFYDPDNKRQHGEL